MDSKYYSEIGKAVEIARKNGGSLTEQNLLYVVKHAVDVANTTGADFDSLLCAGVIGMMNYEKKYDPSQNDNFTKGAAGSINGMMLNVIQRELPIHIPVNHLQGFKKGQKKKDEANVEMVQIDASNYDTLGSVDMDMEMNDREMILQEGLKRLDVNGRIAMEMKLRLGKYSELLPTQNPKCKPKYKYGNNIQDIADELDVPASKASRIYKDAFKKLSQYCQEASNE